MPNESKSQNTPQENNTGVNYFAGNSGLKGLSGLSGSNYDATLQTVLENKNIPASVKITGWLDQGEYADYINANQSNSFGASPLDGLSDKDKLTRFLNTKIINTLGTEKFRNNYKGKTFEEKQAMFQRELDGIDEYKNPTSETWSTMTSAQRKENLERNNPELAKLNNEYDNLLIERDNTNDEITKYQLNDKIEKNRKKYEAALNHSVSFDENDAREIFDNYNLNGKYYDKINKQSFGNLNDSAFKNDMEAYASQIYSGANNTDNGLDKLTYQFDELASGLDPYYKESMVYNAVWNENEAEGAIERNDDGWGAFFTHGKGGIEDKNGIVHSVKPFVNEEDKRRLMSQYYAICALTNDYDLANQYLQEKLTEYRGKNTPLWMKINDTVNGGTTFFLGTVEATAGFAVEGTHKLFNEILAGIGSTVKPEKKEEIRESLGLENNDNMSFIERWWLETVEKGQFGLTKHALDYMDSGVSIFEDKFQNEGQKEYNIQNDLNASDVSYSQVLELLQQTMFTAAGMINMGAAGLVASAVRDTAGGIGRLGARQAITLAGKNAVKQYIGTLADSACKYVLIPMMTSAAEAGQDAYEKYNDQVENAIDKLTSRSQELLEKEIAYDQTTGKFASADFQIFYDENSSIKKKVDYLENKLKEYGENPLFTSNEEVTKYNAYVNLYNKYTNLLGEEFNELKQKYWDEKYQTILDSDDTKNKIKEDAVTAAVTTMSTETAIISGCDLLLSQFFKPLGSVMRRMYKFGSKSPIIMANGIARAKYDTFSKRAASYVGRTLRDSFGEGIEEGSQNITQDVSGVWADNDLSNYLYSKIDPDANERINNSFLTECSILFNAFGESLLSKNTLEAAEMGFFGALIGSPNGFSSKLRRKSIKEMGIRNNYNFFQRFATQAGEYWRSPLLYNVTEVKNVSEEGKKVANYVNDLLDRNPKLKEAISSTQGMLSYTQKFNDAMMNDDAIEMENSEFALYTEGIHLMQLIQGTTQGKAVDESIKQIKNIDVNTPAGKDFVNQLRTELKDNGSNMTDEQVAQMIKDKVTKFENLKKLYVEEVTNIDEKFGNQIDETLKAAIIYNNLASDNKEKMIAEREEIIKKELTYNTSLRDETEESKARKRLVARYGTLAKAKEAIEADEKRKSKDKHYNKTTRKALRKDLDLATNKGKTDVKDIDEVLDANEILSLNPFERAVMLSKRNLKDYSQAQQDIITDLYNKLDGKTIRAIMEAGRLQQQLNRNRDIMEYVNNPREKSMSLWAEANRKAIREKVNNFMGDAINANTQDEFNTAMIARFEKLASRAERLEFISRLDETHRKFYDNFLNVHKARQIRTSALDTLDKEAKKGRGKEYRRIVNLALRNILKNDSRKANEDITTEEVRRTINDTAFADIVKSSLGIDMSTFGNEEYNELDAFLDDQVRKFNNYTRNRVRLADDFGAHHENNYQTSVATDEARGKTIFNKDLYDKNKSQFSKMFETIRDMFNKNVVRNGKTQRYDQMSLYDFVKFAILFDKETTLPADIPMQTIAELAGIKGFSKVTFTWAGLLSLNKAIDKLLTSKEFMDSDHTNSVKIEILKTLHNTISKLQVLDATRRSESPLDIAADAVIEIEPSMKDQFHIGTPEESQEDESRPKKYREVSGDSNDAWNQTQIKLPTDSMSEIESNFYESRAIGKNLEWISKNAKNLKNRKIFFAVMDELVDSDTSMTNEQFPVAMLMEKGKMTGIDSAGVVTIDGKEYVVIGTMKHSVPSNVLYTLPHKIRDIAIDLHRNNETHDPVLVKDGKTIISSKGLTITYTTPKPIETQSSDNESTVEPTDNSKKPIRNGLLEHITAGKNNGITNVSSDELRDIKQKSKRSIFANREARKKYSTLFDFISNTYQGECHIGQDGHTRTTTITVNGKSIVYEDKLSVNVVPNQTYKILVYIEPNELSKQKPIYNLLFIDGDSLVNQNNDKLSDVINYDTSKNTGIQYIERCANAITNVLSSVLWGSETNNLSSFVKNAENNNALISRINRYFNVGSVNSGEYVSISYGITDKKLSIVITPKGQKPIVISLKDIIEKVNEAKNVNGTLAKKNALESIKKDLIIPKAREIIFNIIAEKQDDKFVIRKHKDQNDREYYDVKPQVDYSYFSEKNKKKILGTNESQLTDSEAIYVSDAIRDCETYLYSDVLYNPGSWEDRTISGASATGTTDSIGKKKAAITPKKEIELPNGSKVNAVDQSKLTNSNEEIDFKKVDKEFNDKFSFTPDQKQAKIDSGYTQVTSFITGKEESSNPGTQSIPTTIGTSVDSVAREMMIYNNQHPECTTEEMFAHLKEVYGKDSPIPGIYYKDVYTFAESFTNLRSFFDARGEHIIPGEFLLSGKIESNGKSWDIMGIPDIITIDKSGKLHIYDMKTYNCQLGTRMAEYDSFSNIDFKSNKVQFREIGENKLNKWRKQVTVYKELLESYGYEVASVGIVPIPVRYDYDKYTRNNGTDVKYGKINEKTTVSSEITWNDKPIEIKDPIKFGIDPAIKLEPTSVNDIIEELYSNKEDINPPTPTTPTTSTEHGATETTATDINESNAEPENTSTPKESNSNASETGGAEEARIEGDSEVSSSQGFDMLGDTSLLDIDDPLLSLDDEGTADFRNTKKNCGE